MQEEPPRLHGTRELSDVRLILLSFVEAPIACVKADCAFGGVVNRTVPIDMLPSRDPLLDEFGVD